VLGTSIGTCVSVGKSYKYKLDFAGSQTSLFSDYVKVLQDIIGGRLNTIDKV